MATPSMIQITEDALRAMANLNAAREPNWMEIKKWLIQAKEALKSMAAFAVDASPDKRAFFSGLAWAMNDLSLYSEYPKEALEKMKVAKERSEKKLEGVG